ncbi:MAG: ATP-binding cassette domain-containing protein [Elusimicrobiota bacterium]|nr:ATP-binding cassette domain-containing protein [Endomicrobiia bacterium]MDW8165397.1 ATP-binding cassette domain-containing protein [Elusimicrobiota bacterium]
MIKINNVTKTFGKVVALNNVCFDINDNEILGLLGPNGAGKTTLMRIITGFLPADSGYVSIDGKVVSLDTLDLKMIIGYLPENNPLYEDMNVFEYLKFIAETRNISNINSRIKEVVSICRLEDVLLRNISELSKGYRQRVGFAASILHDPKILILDEPTAGLDPNQAHEVRQLIKEFKKNKIVILSTHILSEVEEVADRVVIINKGQIVAQGNIEDLHSLVMKRNVTRLAGRFNKELIDYLPTVLEGIYQIRLISQEDEIKEYEIETERDLDIREQLFELAVKEKWKLIELHRISVSLQDIFRELTK